MSLCRIACRSITASSKCGRAHSAIPQFAPILPIFVNAAAPPVPTYRRARQLGELVGRFAMCSGKRVLFAASGGLSHDPPLPVDQRRATGDPASVRSTDESEPRKPRRRARSACSRRVSSPKLGKGALEPLNPGAGIWSSWGYPAQRPDLAGLCARHRQGARGGGPRRQRSPAWVAAFGAFSTGGHFKMEAGVLRAISGRDRRHGDDGRQTGRRGPLIRMIPRECGSIAEQNNVDETDVLIIGAGRATRP